MERFGELLFESTDYVVRQVLGESASELIYILMERHVSLKREEISGNVEDFFAYLEKLLGSERARIIQLTSLNHLCSKLRREYEEVERHFSVLDELYETKFKLLGSLLEQERSVCN